MTQTYREKIAARLPQLRADNIQAYTAAVADAIAAGHLSPAQGKGMLYAAQLVLQQAALAAAAKPAADKAK